LVHRPSPRQAPTLSGILRHRRTDSAIAVSPFFAALLHPTAAAIASARSSASSLSARCPPHSASRSLRPPSCSVVSRCTRSASTALRQSSPRQSSHNPNEPTLATTSSNRRRRRNAATKSYPRRSFAIPGSRGVARAGISVNRFIHGSSGALRGPSTAERIIPRNLRRSMLRSPQSKLTPAGLTQKRSKIANCRSSRPPADKLQIDLPLPIIAFPKLLHAAEIDPV
jgi:hypothetical protein